MKLTLDLSDPEAVWRTILELPGGATIGRALLRAAKPIAGPWTKVGRFREAYRREVVRVGPPTGVLGYVAAAEITHIDFDSWAWSYGWSSGATHDGLAAAKAACDEALRDAGVLVADEPDAREGAAPADPSGGSS